MNAHMSSRTTRTTGLWYLGLALTGVLGFLLIRSRLYVPGDAAATLSNLTHNVTLARTGIGIDLAILVTQSGAALWFYRLFRQTDSFLAGSVAALGLVNAAAVTIATAFSATALAVATGASPTADPASTALLLYDLNDAVWSVGSVFFGLWLIPMGRLVTMTKTMPRLLGLLLIGGGIGYVLSVFIGLVAPQSAVVADTLTIPATIGEFWMIGYLIVSGTRSKVETRSLAVAVPAG